MVIDERMASFIDSFDRGNSPFLDEIEKNALEAQVPVIRRPMQSLLKFLLTLLKPKSILEIGTAVGFSALLMSEYGPEGTTALTIFHAFICVLLCPDVLPGSPARYIRLLNLLLKLQQKNEAPSHDSAHYYGCGLSSTCQTATMLSEDYNGKVCVVNSFMVAIIHDYHKYRNQIWSFP